MRQMPALRLRQLRHLDNKPLEMRKDGTFTVRERLREGARRGGRTVIAFLLLSGRVSAVCKRRLRECIRTRGWRRASRVTSAAGSVSHCDAGYAR